MELLRSFNEIMNRKCLVKCLGYGKLSMNITFLYYYY